MRFSPTSLFVIIDPNELRQFAEDAMIRFFEEGGLIPERAKEFTEDYLHKKVSEIKYDRGNEWEGNNEK